MDVKEILLNLFIYLKKVLIYKNFKMNFILLVVCLCYGDK